MLVEIFRLEWRQQIRSPAVALAAFAMGAYAVWSVHDVGAMLARPGMAYNGPALMALVVAMLGQLAVVFFPLYTTAAVLRDIEYRSEEIILSTRVSRRDYAGGRILAAYMIGMLVILICAPCVVFGQDMPWVDQTRIGSTSWYALLWSILVLVVPNTLLVTGFVSLVASRTRSLRATYVGLIVFELLYFASQRALPHLVSHQMAALFDAHGVNELIHSILHSSVDQLNRGLPPLSLAFVANRILWLILGAAVFVLSCISSTPRKHAGVAGQQRAAGVPIDDTQRNGSPLLRTNQRFTVSTWMTQLWSLYRTGASAVIQGPFFAVVIFLCVVAVLFCIGTQEHAVDGPVMPSGSVVFDAVRQGTHWLIYSAVAFYVGELTWRDRECGFANVSDAYPASQGTRFAASGLIVLTVVAILQGAGGLAGYLWHASHGLASLKGPDYVRALAMVAVPYVFFGVLALCLQLIANQRYTGYALCVLWLFFSEVWLPRMGWATPLVNFGHLPATVYSDLSGAWPSIPTALVYAGYWVVGASALVTLTLAIAARSKYVSLRDRMFDVRARLGGWHGLIFVAMLVLFVGLATLIHVDGSRHEAGFSPQQAASYEIKYAKYATKPQLRIASISLAADLSAAHGSLQLRSHYRLTNRNQAPVDEVAVQFPPGFVVQRVGLPPHSDIVNDEGLRFAVYRLQQPVLPGGGIDLDVTLMHRDSPLADNYQATWLVPGRPFVGTSLLPRIGYQPELALSDAQERARSGLGKPVLAQQDTVMDNPLGNDADWIAYQAVLSTDNGRLALTSGQRVASWRRAGRTYFRYVADAPMIDMPPLIFGDYEMRSKTHGDTSITVFFDPGHPWNVDRLLKIADSALAGFGRDYAPYPRASLALVEAAAGSSPQSYPGLILLPEDSIFSAGPAEAATIDTAYHVVAHEIAHQWWGHQVIAAAMPGANMLTESLAEFSALRLYGETHPRSSTDALLDEMQRSYLLGHAMNVRVEPPLIHVQNEVYVAYDKGPLAFHAISLKACGGLAASLREFFLEYRFAPAPYPTAEGLLAKISEDCRGQGSALMNEWFRSVVLHDARLEAPRATRMHDGRFQVTFAINASQRVLFGAVTQGAERVRRIPEVAIYGQPGRDGSRKQLYLGSPSTKTPDGRYEIFVKDLPQAVRLDPRHIWLNRATDGSELPVIISDN
jgi:hypothetical protein